MNNKSFLVMLFGKNNTLIFKILGFILLLFHGLLQSSGYYHFVVEEAPYTRLCSTKNILTVNGQFPGPTLYAHKFDTIYVKVHNRGKENITIHWHGVKEPRNPWSDGPEYITQCPIKPGDVFKYKIKFSTEEGTLWWHAHSDWSRATVHGAIIVYPKKGTKYPFHKPHTEVPIILGEWWKMDVMEVLKLMVVTGGAPNVSDAFTINGQPGDLYPCSNLDTFKLTVDYGKKYLLRMVNANLNEIIFLAIAKHQLTVVGSDGSYTKPLTRDYITIAPGQTIDALFHANQRSDDRYYMAGRAYSSNAAIPFDNTTTTAIVQYSNSNNVNYTTTSTPPPPPLFPSLPYYNDTIAAINFTTAIRSLANHHHPINVPQTITTRMFSTISINSFPCEKINGSCEGPNGTRLAASVTNISFVTPPIDILEAYYYHIRGVYDNRFPNFPPLIFNFTSEDLPLSLQTPRRGTEVKVLDYNSTVEIVFQNTRLVSGLDHPMHLHGYSFYVVGWGFGNFDKDEDPLRYNLVDPPLRNTVMVPLGGWTAIRFKANNPGVWYMHCHFERHLTWGMDMVFIVKDGDTPDSQMQPRPAYMPPC